ncbi:MAG: hypothetical protein R2729_29465 [Bryobacteraceae bacterium]
MSNEAAGEGSWWRMGNLEARGEILLSVVRTPAGLIARVNRASDPGAPGYRTDAIPVAQARGELRRRIGRVLESWDFLRRVTAAGETALFHIAVVLLETVADPAGRDSGDPLPPEWARPHRTVRPTAAHPRAFRGTKSQPPKSAQLAAFDVRPHLCDARTPRDALSPLLKFRERVLPRLLEAGYGEHAIEAALGGARRPMPAEFAMDIWPSVRWALPAEPRLRSLFVELEMASDSRLLAAFARLVNLAGGKTAAGWAGVARTLPAGLRPVLFEVLLETGSYTSLPPRAISGELAEVARLASEGMFPVWLGRVLASAAKGTRLDYLMAGFRLAAQFSPTYDFAEIGACDAFPEAVVEEIVVETESEWMAMGLWERCGELAGFADFIRESAWRQFSQPSRYRYFNFLMGLRYKGLSRRGLKRKWDALRPELKRMEGVIAGAAPDYQRKAAECFEDWIWHWDEPSAIETGVGRACRFLPRLLEPPFPASTEGASAIGWFAELEDDSLWTAVLATPLKSFQAIERACKRSASANLIGRGLRSFIRFLPAFAVDALYAEPAKLARTAEVAGGVDPYTVRTVLATCRDHPLFGLDALDGPLAETCARIREHLPPGVTNPIPAKLSAWARGEVRLTDAQLRRSRVVLGQRLAGTRLSLIERAVMDRIQRDLPAGEPGRSKRHALRMLSNVDGNRRALRRFLRAHWAGDHEYLARRPATVAWYRKHPRPPMGA